MEMKRMCWHEEKKIFGRFHKRLPKGCIEVFSEQPHPKDIYVNGEWIDGPEKAEHIASEVRKEEITEAQEKSPVKGISLPQAKAWIDSKLDGPNPIEGARDIFYEIAKFLIK